jgi:hypothetical protein
VGGGLGGFGDVGSHVVSHVFKVRVTLHTCLPLGSHVVSHVDNSVGSDVGRAVVVVVRVDVSQGLQMGRM